MHEFRGEMKHQRGLGAVCVKVFGVGGEGVPDFRSEGVSIARADKKAAEVGEADLVDGNAKGGVRTPIRSGRRDAR